MNAWPGPAPRASRTGSGDASNRWTGPVAAASSSSASSSSVTASRPILIPPNTNRPGRSRPGLSTHDFRPSL